MKDIVDLRDEIAVAAMSQCLALFGKSFGKKEISVWAYEMADEMLAAREPWVQQKLTERNKAMNDAPMG